MDRSILRALAATSATRRSSTRSASCSWPRPARGWTSCARAADGDTEALRTSAHALKGSSANVGAVAVSARRRIDAAKADLEARVRSRLADAVRLTRAALAGRVRIRRRRRPGRAPRARGGTRDGARLRAARTASGVARSRAVPDVLITDWMMPGFAGPDLCSWCAVFGSGLLRRHAHRAQRRLRSPHGDGGRRRRLPDQAAGSLPARDAPGRRRALRTRARPSSTEA